MKRNYVHLLMVVLFLAVTLSHAETMNILVPYMGAIANVYEDSSLDLEDTGLMAGLYFQSIDPDRYQWNAFVYHSPDVNYSKLWGGHFIFDAYFGNNLRGKYLLGAGIEIISLDMDAADEIFPLQDFTLTYTITVPYVRAGKYFQFRQGPIVVSILPWAGVQPEFVSGDVKFSAVFGPPPTPPTNVSESIDDTDWFGIAGLNLKVNLYHFIEIEGKYQATFNGDDYRSTVNALVNLFLNRSWGLSYRYKYMETSSGSDAYHLLGIACVF